MSTKLALKSDLKAIEYAQLASSTKAQYTKAVKNYLATGAKLTDANALADYAQGLKPSSRSFLKAGIRLLTMGLANDLKAGATPDNLPQVQAALYRIEALQDAVQIQTSKGIKAHVWLSQAQVKELMSTCDGGIVGLRDFVVLGLLVGAGLRRDELATLQFSNLLEIPTKNSHTRTVINVHGKGDKNRAVPISALLAGKIREWQTICGDGLIARSLGRKCELGTSLSAIGEFNICRKHGKMIGIEVLDPHDLRRTYAQLGYEAGIPITQISNLLGHADIATTQRYLNLTLDLETTVSDFIPLA